MKDTKHAYAKQYRGMGQDSPSMVFPFGVSFLFHLIVIGALVFMPQFGSKPRFGSGVVNVSLVSLPSSGTDSAGPVASVVKPEPAEKKPVKKPAVKIPEPKPVPAVKKPPEAVSLAPKTIKPKKSLKKETFDRSKIIDSAIDRIEKKVEKTETDSVASAIEELKRKVAATESQTETGTGGSGKAVGGVAGPAGGSGGGGARVQESILIYQAEIQYQIQKNWAFSQQLAGDNTQLEAVLAIKVLRNGEIEDIWFDKKSGNGYLDDSAYKAIVKSNPLPPLPNDYMGPHYKVGLRFGPKGLKNE